MPVRAAFAYKKKVGRREYVRVSLRHGTDGVLEAIKFPREGAGLLSSLVDTDGLVELGEDEAMANEFLHGLGVLSAPGFAAGVQRFRDGAGRGGASA